MEDGGRWRQLQDGMESGSLQRDVQGITAMDVMMIRDCC